MSIFLSRVEVLTLGGGVAAGAVLEPGRALAQTGSVLHVGYTGIEAQAQAMYADELGLFKQAGLNVEVAIQRGGAVTVAGVAAGALQIGCANPISLGQAIQRKLPFVMLASAVIWDTKRPNAYAAVVPDSPIKSAKDLNGKVIGVASLGGIEQLFMETFMRQDGGDPTTVKFIEVSDALGTEALIQGRIAAKFLDEPMFSAAGNRVRAIGTPPDAIAPRFAEAVWFTTQDWLAQNKDLARRFIAAIIAAGKWAMANPEAAAVVLEKRLGFKEARAVVNYATSPDPSLLQVVFDAAAKYKMLSPLRVTDYFWNGK